MINVADKVHVPYHKVGIQNPWVCKLEGEVWLRVSRAVNGHIRDEVCYAQ